MAFHNAASDPRVTRWLYLVAVITFCLIIFGGFVRLTRSGLSIVEWNPVVGVMPPVGEAAWHLEFAKYQQTPEYRTVNAGMSLAGYQRIFYIEWAHRLIARIAGLAVVLPLAVFLWRGLIPWRQSGLFIGIAALFGLQGFLGWFMVSSGLLDTPAVSHYRLTIHLLMAMLLLAITLWAAMNRDPRVGRAVRRPGGTAVSRLALVTLAAATLQIAWGGLVAGLKAGHVSYSWPLMGGNLIPAGLLAGGDSWWTSISAMPAAVHWIHRWFAWVVAAMVAWLMLTGRNRRTVSPEARRSIHVVAGLIGVQVVLGVSVLWFHVPVTLALLHQAVGLAIFAALLVVNHQLLRRDRTT
ncbi:MAG: COX15/CtaA family protein [Acidobacteria bacterium]|nr:COX15/CtaA family protein [Acidobacteriota bacterium]